MEMGPQLTQTAHRMGIREGWEASVGNSGSRNRRLTVLEAAIPSFNPDSLEISQSDDGVPFPG